MHINDDDADDNDDDWDDWMWFQSSHRKFSDHVIGQQICKINMMAMVMTMMMTMILMMMTTNFSIPGRTIFHSGNYDDQ